MKHHFAPRVLLIEIFAHSAHDHNRKLKTFALMDTHDPDNVLVLPDHVCLAEIHIIFLQLIDITHKMKQSFVTRLLVGCGFFQKHV